MSDITKQQVVTFIENMTVLELAAFVKELEEKFGVSAAAPAGRRGRGRSRCRGRGGAVRVRRHPHGRRPGEDQGHQGDPHADRSRPQGGQGGGRRGPQARQGEGLQGRGGEHQEGPRGRRRHGAGQVASAVFGQLSGSATRHAVSAVMTLRRSMGPQMQGARALRNEAHRVCAAVTKGELQRRRWGSSERLRQATVSEGTK